MKTCLDCIPCFFRQLLDGARIARLSPRQQQKLINGFARKVPAISLESTPPEIARFAYMLLRRVSSNNDLYYEIKRKSNRCALRLVGKLRDKVKHSEDRLLTAVELAIAGNIIDFGVKNNLDVKTELRKILARENKSIRNAHLFRYTEFKRALRKAKRIVYLGDNAGEVVFDRILVEEIKRLYPDKEMYYAVKSRPVINDALREDADACGIGSVARVITNGADAPGTILSLCSKEFRRLYKSADMVISKGQGNFESLSQEHRPIFFLLMAKCPVVAREINCALGDIVLLYNLKKNRK